MGILLSNNVINKDYIVFPLFEFKEYNINNVDNYFKINIDNYDTTEVIKEKLDTLSLLIESFDIGQKIVFSGINLMIILKDYFIIPIDEETNVTNLKNDMYLYDYSKFIMSYALNKNNNKLIANINAIIFAINKKFDTLNLRDNILLFKCKYTSNNSIRVRLRDLNDNEFKEEIKKVFKLLVHNRLMSIYVEDYNMYICSNRLIPANFNMKQVLNDVKELLEGV